MGLASLGGRWLTHCTIIFSREEENIEFLTPTDKMKKYRNW